MNYLLTMTLSGSSMLLVYFCLKFTLKKRMTKRWQYFLLKAVMLYYMIPLPLLGMLYHKLYRCYFKENSLETLNAVHFYSNDKVIYQIGSHIAISPGYRYRLLSMGLWVLAAGIVFGVCLILYFARRRALLNSRLYKENSGAHSTNAAPLPDSFKMLEQCQQSLHIRRKVALCACGAGQKTSSLEQNALSPEQSALSSERNTLFAEQNALFAFSIGFFKPVIFCTLPENPLEQKMLLTHELIHIKRLDVLWKAAGIIVWRLHWFNPLIYLFLREFHDICEESCDELVTNGYGRNERFLYAAMLVRYAAAPKIDRLWETALSENARRIERRTSCIIENQPQKGRWHTFIPVSIMCALIFLNSTTAFAYEDVTLWSGDSINAQAQSGPWEITNSAFLSENTPDIWIDTTPDWKQYVDEAGQIYPHPHGNIYPHGNTYPHGNASFSECPHAYESGISKCHVKQPDGTCQLYYYHSKYCFQCGDTVYWDFIAASPCEKDISH